MRYRVSPWVAWVAGEDIGSPGATYVVDVRDGRPLVLRESAEVIWLVAADGGDLPDDVPVPDAVEPSTVQDQIVDFAAQLVSLGLLEEDS